MRALVPPDRVLEQRGRAQRLVRRGLGGGAVIGGRGRVDDRVGAGRLVVARRRHELAQGVFASPTRISRLLGAAPTTSVAEIGQSRSGGTVHHALASASLSDMPNTPSDSLQIGQSTQQPSCVE